MRGHRTVMWADRHSVARHLEYARLYSLQSVILEGRPKAVLWMRGVVDNPTGSGRDLDPARPSTPERVQRGGSFLCNDDYCSRYRPSARHGCSPDTGMSHVGFRCVAGR